MNPPHPGPGRAACGTHCHGAEFSNTGDGSGGHMWQHHLRHPKKSCGIDAAGAALGGRSCRGNPTSETPAAPAVLDAEPISCTEPR